MTNSNWETPGQIKQLLDLAELIEQLIKKQEEENNKLKERLKNVLEKKRDIDSNTRRTG